MDGAVRLNTCGVEVRNNVGPRFIFATPFTVIGILIGILIGWATSLPQFWECYGLLIPFKSVCSLFLVVTTTRIIFITFTACCNALEISKG